MSPWFGTILNLQRRMTSSPVCSKPSASSPNSATCCITCPAPTTIFPERTQRRRSVEPKEEEGTNGMPPSLPATDDKRFMVPPPTTAVLSNCSICNCRVRTRRSNAPALSTARRFASALASAHSVKASIFCRKASASHSFLSSPFGRFFPPLFSSSSFRSPEIETFCSCKDDTAALSISLSSCSAAKSISFRRSKARRRRTSVLEVAISDRKASRSSL
mmetsp:Transcript_11450/g.25119  ORF Transcript_11450/g.25119 Transcript_11450/m.25119 type:complete len:218 (+) Transcript_11450:496-1149(+)